MIKKVFNKLYYNPLFSTLCLLAVLASNYALNKSFPVIH